MRIFIPTVGTILTLSQAWTFDLHDERRNRGLFEYLGAVPIGRKDEKKAIVRLKVGQELKIDRIYIRKGIGDFDSVSFLLVGEKTKRREISEIGVRYMETPRKPSSLTVERFEYTEIRRPRSVRFWAKLDDVNKMEVENVW